MVIGWCCYGGCVHGVVLAVDPKFFGFAGQKEKYIGECLLCGQSLISESSLNCLQHCRTVFRSAGVKNRHLDCDHFTIRNFDRIFSLIAEVDVGGVKR
jgi:hypothetical protein